MWYVFMHEWGGYLCKTADPWIADALGRGHIVTSCIDITRPLRVAKLKLIYGN